MSLDTNQYSSSIENAVSIDKRHFRLQFLGIPNHSLLTNILNQQQRNIHCLRCEEEIAVDTVYIP